MQGDPVTHDALVYLASLDSNRVRLGLHRMERALDVAHNADGAQALSDGENGEKRWT